MDKRKQVKNSLIYIAPKMITAFFSIGALAIYTRFLSKYDFGVFALAEVCAVVLSGIVNFGMLLGFERNFFKYEQDFQRKELLYSTLFFLLVIFAFVSGATYFFKDALSKWIIQSGSYGDLLFVMFCATVFVSFNQYYYFYFRSDEKPKSFAFYTVLFNLLNVFFPVFFIVVAKKGLMGLAWGQLCASLSVFILLGIKFLRETSFSINLSYLKEVFKISYPLTPRIFFGVINAKISTYILAIMNTVGGVGLFSVAQRFANIVFMFMTTIQNVFNPGVYKKMFSKKADSGEEIGIFLTPFLYWSVAFALVMSLFSKEILYLLTAREFHGASNIMTVLSVYYAILFFGKITSLQLIFRKKTFITSALAVFTIGANVVLAIPLTKKFGAMGASWSILLVGVITGGVSFIIAQHFFRIKWETKKTASIFIVLIGSSLFVLIASFFQMPYAICLAFKFVFLSVYFYIGSKMHVITKENFVMVREMFFKGKNKDVDQVLVEDDPV